MCLWVCVRVPRARLHMRRVTCRPAPFPPKVRGKLYELLANCIPPELLLRTLLVELLKKLDDELKVGGWVGGWV